MPLINTNLTHMPQTSSRNPFFSIITVTLNNLNGLERTYNSLQNQSFTDYEWIVVDGLSNDGTQDFLQKINSHYISEADNGIYGAMNKGIKRARGTYLIFMNAGDQFAAQNTLKIINNYITNNPTTPDFIYGDSYEGGHYKRAKPHKSIKYRMFTHHQAMVYRHVALNDLKYNTSYKIAADYEFTALFLRNIKNVLYIKDVLCIFEPDGISQKNAKLGRLEQFKIRRKLKINNIVTNASIYIIQTVMWKFRQHSPQLFWRLKD